MPTDPISVQYADHPWGDILTNNHDVYVPALLDTFRKRSLYGQYVNFQIDLGAQRAKRMIFTELYDAEPNWSPVTLRNMWIPSAHVDSRSITVDVEYHQGKIGAHKYDTLVNQWLQNGGDLIPICRGLLGNMLVEHRSVLVA